MLVSADKHCNDTPDSGLEQYKLSVLGGMSFAGIAKHAKDLRLGKDDQSSTGYFYPRTPYEVQ